jgi:hypothetical protein
MVKKGSTVIGKTTPYIKILQKPNPSNYKDRRLILNETTGIEEKINPLKLRNQINKIFQEKRNIITPIVVIISKSFAGTSIVLITIEYFSTEFLTQNKAI